MSVDYGTGPDGVRTVIRWSTEWTAREAQFLLRLGEIGAYFDLPWDWPPR